MAMVVPQYQRQVVQQASRPVGVEAAQSGMGQIAQGLGNVGQMFDQFQTDIDEANAKRADTEYADRVRKTLYEDRTGYLYSQGGDALQRREQAAQTLQKDYDDILGALTPNQREMAQAAMESRRQSSLTNVDRHVSTERITYLNDAGDARIRSAVDDAILDPGALDRSLSITRNEVREKGARLGWAPEVTKAAEDEAVGQMHAGIVTRLANVDPEQALGYLNAHRDSMGAKAVASLEGPLVADAKRRKGRDIGVAAARGASGIGPDYYASIRAAESGGNDAAKNPSSSATGRYQFIQSTWDGLRQKHPQLGLTAGGRLDPEQQERAIRAFTEDNARALVRAGVAVTNGTLYAAHFLGAGTAAKVLRAGLDQSMSSLVGAGVMAANKFLNGKTVGDFIAWAEDKAGGQAPQGQPQGAGGVRALLAIEDPDVRASAMQEYQLWSGQFAAEEKARQDAAQQSAFAQIVAGGDVNDLPLADKIALGQSGLSSLMDFQTKVRAKRPIETDPELFVELTQQAATDPEAFAARDPLDWLGKLSQSDWQAMTKKQADAMAGADPQRAVTVSTIDTVSADVLKAAGVTTGAKAGSDQWKTEAAKQARFQEGLLRWAQDFQADNGGKQPTHLQIREQANAMLMQVVLDPPGLFNKQDGPAFALDFEGVTPADVLDGSLKVNGKDVPPEAVEAFVTAFEAALGRAPTPAEVVEGLAASGAY